MGREKQAINRSHGRRTAIRDAIRAELETATGDFWQIKYNLASRLVAEYGVKIGTANHLIEQEARRLHG